MAALAEGGDGREMCWPRRMLPCLGVDETKFARRREKMMMEAPVRVALILPGQEWEALALKSVSFTRRSPFSLAGFPSATRKEQQPWVWAAAHVTGF